jgi:hypothetical protein
MRVIETAIGLDEVRAIARTGFGEMVKAVVDVARGIMVIDGELHADEEALLLQSGSAQQDLWGINIYPDLEEPDRIEFDSMINIRPSHGNRTRGVDDAPLREQIIRIVNQLVVP